MISLYLLSLSLLEHEILYTCNSKTVNKVTSDLNSSEEFHTFPLTFPICVWWNVSFQIGCYPLINSAKIFDFSQEKVCVNALFFECNQLSYVTWIYLLNIRWASLIVLIMFSDDIYTYIYYILYIIYIYIYIYIKFDIKVSGTTSLSPWTNSTYERGRNTITTMLLKISDDVNCSYDIEFPWAINAKSYFISHNGFSLSQIILWMNFTSTRISDKFSWFSIKHCIITIYKRSLHESKALFWVIYQNYKEVWD